MPSRALVYARSAARTLARDEARVDVELDLRRIAFERVSATAATPGVGDQQVAGLDLDAVDLRGQHPSVAKRRDKSATRAAAGEHRVVRGRRAVDHVVDLFWTNPGLFIDTFVNLGVSSKLRLRRMPRRDLRENFQP